MGTCIAPLSAMAFSPVRFVPREALPVVVRFAVPGTRLPRSI
jgi:hypothetical protein